MIRILAIAVAFVIGSIAAASLVKAQDLGEGLLRPMEPGVYKAEGGPRISPVLSLTAGVMSASAVTLARYISAVRLTCDATCFVSVSASNGASMINFISGGHLGAAGESVVYRTNGGEYVIGYSVSTSSVYIQELTR